LFASVEHSTTFVVADVVVVLLELDEVASSVLELDEVASSVLELEEVVSSVLELEEVASSVLELEEVVLSLASEPVKLAIAFSICCFAVVSLTRALPM
jgi:hypothetical protein